MSITDREHCALDYRPCRYGASRINFRGPKRELKGRYIAFLGGTETYGKFIQSPFPTLVEQSLGVPCVNFGCVNAGLDVFLHDSDVLAAAAGAEVTVVQILGAQNMSNRFYRVHPRRNDRFVTASALMQSVFRDVDFSEFSFTRHMLKGLSDQASDRFSFVREELRGAWCARMKTLLDRLPGRKILLWFAEHSPPLQLPKSAIGHDPLFVDASMIEDLRPLVDGVAQVRLSDSAKGAGTAGMRYGAMEKPAAKQMLGPLAHEEAARVLVNQLGPLLTKSQRKRPV